MQQSALYTLRLEYHRKILQQVLGRRAKSGAFSNADSSSKASTELAERIASKLAGRSGQRPTRRLPKEQTVGNIFARLTNEFLRDAFNRLHHLRPGRWTFSTSQESEGIAKYYQYEHLAELGEIITKYPEVRSTLGGDYFVTPDIIVSRKPVTDEDINEEGVFVNGSGLVARHAPLRESVNKIPILHASVSCKWTIRSDRAQNTRTEALNLIRNRKGKVPIVVAVTFEPMPTRIASIALGVGDLDCTYHGALHELLEAVEETHNEDQRDMLKTLVQGRRLRDISDLPLDLAT
jgi:hypothetical protein